MGRFKDLTGNRYGQLVVLHKAEVQDATKLKWTCLCDCGNTKDVIGDALVRSLTKSCGCYRHDKTLDITGKVYGRLTAREQVKKNNRTYWICDCECGNTCEVALASLQTGNTQSCGCYRTEMLKNRTGENSPVYKGASSANELVRKSKSYKTWRAEVFDRDDYTCQKCKVRGGRLEAHHIHDFSSYEDARTDVNNGVTLCKEHHKEFHSIFGNQYSNNAYQLIGYLTIK